MADPWADFRVKSASAVAPAAAAGDPWADFRKAPAKPEVQPQNVSDALANSFGQGATFNFGDELAAAVRSKLPEISNWMMERPRETAFSSGDPNRPDPRAAPQAVSAAPTSDQRYGEELAKIRAQTTADAKANPTLMEGANIAGNVAGGLAATPFLPGALTSVGPSLLANVAKGATLGAGFGAVSGFGSGEGGFENRMGNAAMPAVVGAGLGGAFPVGGALLDWVNRGPIGRSVARNITDPIARALTGEAGPLGGPAESVVQQGMIDRLVTAAQRGRVNPAEAQGTLDTLGSQAMVADASPAFRSVAETAYTLPGQTFARAGAPGSTEGVLAQRAMGAPDRMIKALESGGAPPEAADLAKAFPLNTQNVGRASYGAADAAGLNQSPELRAMLDNPIVDEAIKKVLSTDAAARVGRPTAPPMSPVEVLNEVQKMIKAKGFVEGTAIPGPNMQPYRDLATDYGSTLRRDNPALDQAMRLYSEAKSLPDYFQTGAGAMGKQGAGTEAGIERSVAGVRNAMEGATPQQAAAGRAGFINAARMQAEEGTPGALALAKRVTESSPLQAKAAILTDQRLADELLRQSKAERVFQTTNDIRGNSATTRRLANAADEGLDNLQVRANPQGITTRMIESVGRVLKNITAPNEAVRDELGRVLLNPDAAQNRKLLEALAAALQSRSTSGVPRAVAAGSTANQINEAIK